jgi:hypothetical protein
LRQRGKDYAAPHFHEVMPAVPASPTPGAEGGPAAPATPTEEPANVDPFGAGMNAADAFGTQPAPAGDALDPFSTPAAPAAPAGDAADPFGTAPAGDANPF